MLGSHGGSPSRSMSIAPSVLFAQLFLRIHLAVLPVIEENRRSSAQLPAVSVRARGMRRRSDSLIGKSEASLRVILDVALERRGETPSQDQCAGIQAAMDVVRPWQRHSRPSLQTATAA
jgi:hypothetical protein